LVRTIQLRRYEIAPGMLEEFRAWVNLEVLPIRKQFGFRVEFVYIDNKNSEFIWAVSVQGAAAEFLELEKRYNESEERAAAGAKRPDCLISADIRFVEEN